ncbi:MAG: hypothetical protein BGO05_05390 [Rhizobiales bacterium 63-7]|nr:MAG: hypothetical protein BGO05_05390 [Rhizobiales bacterium 63-7]
MATIRTSETLPDEDRASIGVAADQAPKRTPVAILPVEHKLPFSRVQQRKQPVARSLTALPLAGAFRVGDLRRVDIREPDLHAAEPERIAVHDAIMAETALANHIAGACCGR